MDGLHSWAAEDKSLSSLIENRVCVVTKLKFPSQGLQDGICKAPWCEVLSPLHTPTHALTQLQLSPGEKELHFLRMGHLPSCTCL